MRQSACRLSLVGNRTAFWRAVNRRFFALSLGRGRHVQQQPAVPVTFVTAAHSATFDPGRVVAKISCTDAGFTPTVVAAETPTPWRSGSMAAPLSQMDTVHSHHYPGSRTLRFTGWTRTQSPLRSCIKGREMDPPVVYGGCQRRLISLWRDATRDLWAAWVSGQSGSGTKTDQKS